MKPKPGDLVVIKPMRVIEVGSTHVVVDYRDVNTRFGIDDIAKVMPRGFERGDRVMNTGTQAEGTVLCVHGDSVWFLGDVDKKRRTVLLESLVRLEATK